MADNSALVAAREVRVTLSRIRRRLRGAADNDGLTPTQSSVLSRLVKDGPASASDLATAERVRPQSVAATLQILDERGMIERHPDPNDGRRQLISPSTSGRAFFTTVSTAREEWLTDALQHQLTESERAVVISAMALLERIATSHDPPGHRSAKPDRHHID